MPASDPWFVYDLVADGRFAKGREMTIVDNDGPRVLERCDGCVVPVEPNDGAEQGPEPVRTVRCSNTPSVANSAVTEHLEPAERDVRNAPNADRTTDAEHATPTPGGAKGFWRARWEWLAEWGLLLPIWVLAAGLGVAGFTVSFVTVEQKMRRWFGELAWVVPAAVDLSIIVFTLLDIFLARRNQRIPWLRYIPWLMTAATIYLNVTAYNVAEAQVAHAVLPSLWVVFSEAIARIMREKAQEEKPVTKQVPLIRWVCAPVATLTLWRAMKLWKISTYDQALEIEEERQLAKAVMKDCFGSLRSAPRTLKVRYRQRKITVAEVYSAAAASTTVNAARSAPAGSAAERQTRRRSLARPLSSKTEDAERQVVRSAPVPSDREQGVRSGGGKSRSPKTRPASDRAPRDARSSNERLSEALADLRNEGVVDPSIRMLAARAGCSTSTAHTFKKGIANPGVA
jgi:hypothetical protein